MKNHSGLKYDAVYIEHSLETLLELDPGERGNSNDADIFRGGDKKALAKLVNDIAEKIDQRLSRIKGRMTDRNIEEIKLSVDRLKTITKLMENSDEREEFDYHWMIVAAVARSLGAIFDHCGA